MSPIPLDKLVRDTQSNLLVDNPSFDVIAEPSPATLAVLSPESSGMGTLAVAAIAAGISILVIIQGIVFWRSRRHWSRLNKLVFLREHVDDLFGLRD